MGKASTVLDVRELGAKISEVLRKGDALEGGRQIVAGKIRLTWEEDEARQWRVVATWRSRSCCGPRDAEYDLQKLYRTVGQLEAIQIYNSASYSNKPYNIE